MSLSKFKDKCDLCNEYSYCKGYEDLVLCSSCIALIEKCKNRKIGWKILKEGIERIKTLSQDVKDGALIKVIQYLCSREDMDEKYLNEEKSLKQMVDYINQRAKELRNNNESMIMVDDEEVFGWAIHYFDEDNSKLNLDDKQNNDWDYRSAAKEIKEEKVSVPKSKTEKPKKKEWKSEGQLTLFDFIN